MKAMFYLAACGGGPGRPGRTRRAVGPPRSGRGDRPGPAGLDRRLDAGPRPAGRLELAVRPGVRGPARLGGHRDAQATTAQLAATAHLPGSAAAAGPFPEGTVTATIPVTPPPGVSGPPGGGVFQTQLTVVARPRRCRYTPGVPGQRSGSVVEAGPGPGPAWPSLAAQESAVQAALRAQPGTLHYVANDDRSASSGYPITRT